MRDEYNLAKKVKEIVLSRGRKECETVLWWGENGTSGEESQYGWTRARPYCRKAREVNKDTTYDGPVSF